MSHHVLVAVVLSLAGVASAAPATSRPIYDESPQQREARLRWWRDARFGMFIHFGLYAIPAGEWNGEPIKGTGEWIMDHKKIAPNEYGRLTTQFNPAKFDAKRWVQIAKDAGMKYIVLTTKHHDGFCLFDSKFTEYDVMSTPFKRDIMRELSDAARAVGIQVGWYHSILDWHDPDAQRDETFATYEWRMRNQVSELLTNYGPIGVMWFDGEWIPQWTDARGENLYRLCRSVQPNVIVNNRVGKHRAGMGGFTKSGGFAGDYATPEQEIPEQVAPGVDWETCMTMNDTWGFRKDDTNWKPPQALIRQLIDIASKGGNFLLNVGPTAQGEIPQASVDRLATVGAWLRANGESIYGTSASPFKTKIEWGRATYKGNRIYLHVFDWPKDRQILVPLLSRPMRAYVLGKAETPLALQQNKKGVVIRLPEQAMSDAATVIVLQVDGNPQVVQPPPPATAQALPATTTTTTRAATKPATTPTTKPATTPTTAPTSNKSFPA